MATDGTSNEGLWWRWTHGKSGSTASSSHESLPYDVNNHTSNSKVVIPSTLNELRWQKHTFRTPKEEKSSSTTSSVSWEAGVNSTSSKSSSATASLRQSRAVAVPAKRKTHTPSISSRGFRNEKKKMVETSAFLFSTREDQSVTSEEVFWSMGKSKRPVPKKEKRNGKRSSSLHSNHRAVATRDVHFFSNAQEEKLPNVNASVFASSMQQNKPNAIFARESSNFDSRNETNAQFSTAKKTTNLELNGNSSRGKVTTFSPTCSSVASTTSTSSFDSHSSSTVDPLVSCARAVLQDCIRTRKLEQSKAPKRSIEGCFDGKDWWHHDSATKPSKSGILGSGSSSSSDDELSQLSSMDQSFCKDKSIRDCDGKLVKEEIYRQILMGDYDLSSSPEFQCFSPLVEEKGLPIEVRYQLPLALGTVNEISTECTICQLRYGIGDHIVTLPCQHFFHACCVDKWLWNHTSCPLCRTEVSLDQEVERSNNVKHNFTECSVVDQERIRRQMRSTSQCAGFRPVIPVEIDQLESEVSRMVIDEESEVDLVCPTPHYATDSQDE